MSVHNFGSCGMYGPMIRWRAGSCDVHRLIAGFETPSVHTIAHIPGAGQLKLENRNHEDYECHLSGIHEKGLSIVWPVCIQVPPRHCILEKEHEAFDQLTLMEGNVSQPHPMTSGTQLHYK